MPLLRLIFRDFAPGCAFHAARVPLSASQNSRVERHSHDFYEWIVVLSGEARHRVNGVDAPLRAGTLVLIRPDDVHEIEPEKSESVEFVNIAFPQDVWRDFVAATGLEPLAGHLPDEHGCVRIDLTTQEAAEMTAAALTALKAFHAQPDRLAFCAFWQVAARCLADHARDRASDTLSPRWLRDACDWAQATSLDALNLNALTEQSGMSYGHLCRTMQSVMNVSPTQFLNTLRLRHAAYLLATTDAAITDIAFDCGFETLSYFYRRFGQAYAETPGAFRRRARQAVTPMHGAPGMGGFDGRE